MQALNSCHVCHCLTVHDSQRER